MLLTARQAAAGFALFCCTACTTATAGRAPHDSVLLIASGGETEPKTSPPTLNWRGAAPRMPAKFALFTTRGYAGLVRILGFVPKDSELVRAVLLHGKIPTHFRAIGPVSGPLEKLEMKELEGEFSSATWQVVLVVDLDGDGRRDYEQVLRCNTYQRSGCNERVCSEICTGTRRVREIEPARETIECTSFIPDIHDCER
jgi:hypothetical protein